MLEYFIKQIIKNVTDWSIVLFVVSFIIWFALTQPVLVSDSETSQTPPQINTNELSSHVQVLTQSFTPRTKNYDFLDVTADYIYKKFNKLGYAQYQTIETLAGNYKNVILELGANTRETIVIGAHYDAENDSLDTEGNASGIASLLELARVLSKQQQKLKVKVLLVAYPLSQEQNAYQSGSFFHASSLKKAGKNVRLMISLDSVGQFSAEKNSQKYPFKFMQFVYPTTGDFINVTARLQDYPMVRQLKKSFDIATELPVLSQNLPESFNYVDSNDHKNYWKHGFPAILISDTKEYRMQKNPNATRARMDYDKMADLVKGLFQLVMDTQPLNESRTQLAEEKTNTTRTEALLNRFLSF